MGFFSLKFLVSCIVGSSRIKVMSVDGHCKKFNAPMHVKELLITHPNHAVFHSDTVRKLGSKARPLQETLALQPGQLYFLIPEPQRQRDSKGSGMPSIASEKGPTAEQRLSSLRRQISLASLSSNNDSSDCVGSHKPFSAAAQKPALEVLPASSDGVVRLKMVISKRQLEAVLKDGGDTLSVVQSLVNPMLKEAAARRSDSGSDREYTRSRESSFTWRPALESVTESSCPQQRAARHAD